MYTSKLKVFESWRIEDVMVFVKKINFNLSGFHNIEAVSHSSPASFNGDIPDFLKTLPFFNEKENIIEELVKNNYPMIIKSKTGSGKSLLIGLMILLANPEAKILIVEPTKIAAEEIAAFLSQSCGSLIGFWTATKKEYDLNRTRIFFVTNGIANLLLEIKKCSFTHVVIDECHNRTIKVNQLIKKLKHKDNLRIILMSATVDDLFFQSARRYFDNVTFFESLVGHVACIQKLDFNEQLIPEPVDGVVYGIPKSVEPEVLNQRCIELAKKIFLRSKKNLLIICPGIETINRVRAAIFDLVVKQYKCQIVRMHSSLRETAKAKTRTVFIAANNAESALTLEDVETVIDMCRTKYFSSYNEHGIYWLIEDWCSMLSHIQRGGRVGRLFPGQHISCIDGEEVLGLASIHRNNILDCQEMESALIAFTKPGSSPNVLTDMFDDANLNTIEKALQSLELQNLVKSLLDGTRVVTGIGALIGMSFFPPALLKLAYIGYVYGCFKPCAYLAAALAIKTNFIRHKRNIHSPLEYKKWKKIPSCEHLTYANALETFHIWSLKNEDEKKMDPDSEWFRDTAFQLQTAQEAIGFLNKLISLFIRLGYICDDEVWYDENLFYNRNSEDHCYFILAVVGALGNQWVDGFYRNDPTSSLFHKIPETDLSIINESQFVNPGGKVGVCFTIRKYKDDKKITPMTYIDPDIFANFGNIFREFYADEQNSHLLIPLIGNKLAKIPCSNAKNVVFFRQCLLRNIEKALGLPSEESIELYDIFLPDSLRKKF